MEEPLGRKRREADSVEQSMPAARSGDAKRKRVPANIAELAPYDVFLRLPPLLVGAVYISVVDHLEALINGINLLGSPLLSFDLISIATQRLIGDLDSTRQFVVLPALLPVAEELQGLALDLNQLNEQLSAVVCPPVALLFHVYCSWVVDIVLAAFRWPPRTTRRACSGIGGKLPWWTAFCLWAKRGRGCAQT